jgi:hypothetical protein
MPGRWCRFEACQFCSRLDIAKSPAIQVKTVNLFRLPVAVIIMLAMTLGSYMLPQRALGGQFTLPMECLGRCSEKAPGEEVLKSFASSAEQAQDEGRTSLPSFSAEEETEGDEFLLSQLAFIIPRRGDEHDLSVLPQPSCYVTDQSRRPPRVSIA